MAAACQAWPRKATHAASIYGSQTLTVKTGNAPRRWRLWSGYWNKTRALQEDGNEAEEMQSGFSSEDDAIIAIVRKNIESLLSLVLELSDES